MRGADPAASGPTTPWTRFHVVSIPLLVSLWSLQRFIASYLNSGAGSGRDRFVAAGPWIYLLHFKRQGRPASRLLERGVAFAVPVLRMRTVGGLEVPVGWGLASPYLFLTSDDELLRFGGEFGVQVAVSDIRSGNPGRRTSAADLGFSVAAIDYSALGRGELPTVRRVVEASAVGPGTPAGTAGAEGAIRWPGGAPGWLPIGGFDFFALKQFRDAQVPEEACVQKRVCVRFAVGAMDSMVVGPGHEVVLADLGWLPFARRLGLHQSPMARRGGGGPTAPVVHRTAISWRFDCSVGIAASLTVESSGQRTPKRVDPLRVQVRPSGRESATLFNPVLGTVLDRLDRAPRLLDLLWRVLPLPGRRSVLEALLDAPPFRVPGDTQRLKLPAGPVETFLLAESYRRADLGQGVIVDAPFDVVNLLVPVDWYDGETLIGRAIVVPFLFSNSVLNVAMNRWHSGFPGDLAKIDFLPGDGATGHDPKTDLRLLEVCPGGADGVPLITVDGFGAPATGKDARTSSPSSSLFEILDGRYPLHFLLHRWVRGLGDEKRPYEALVCTRVTMASSRSRRVRSPVVVSLRKGARFNVEKWFKTSRGEGTETADAWTWVVPESGLFEADVEEEVNVNVLTHRPGEGWRRTVDPYRFVRGDGVFTPREGRP